MKVNYEIVPEFSFLKNELMTIISTFDNRGEIIYDKRNLIKNIDFLSFNINVKRFKKPNIINKFIYGKFRDSKARRSFYAALKLKELGINTPEPIAYIENFNGLLLDYSYYISIHIDYDYTFRDFVEGEPENEEKLIEEFAHFSILMQQKGVWNPDHSPGNTLFVLNEDRSTDFYLVDLNRIKFKPVSIEMGIHNFDRLWASDKHLKIIGRIYAKEYRLDENLVVNKMIELNNALKNKMERKKRIKHFFNKRDN